MEDCNKYKYILYERALRELQLYNEDAWKWIVNRLKPEHWVNIFSLNYLRSDMLFNHFFESFNSFILEARQKLIISMMESIRVSLIERIVRRMNKIRREPRGSVCPMIKNKIEEAVIL